MDLVLPFNADFQMQKQAKEIRYFLYSQAFADGIRITMAILLPSLVAGYFGQLKMGLAISLGALCVSLADTPGPLVHKKNGMLICAGFVFLVALVTPFARQNPWTMGLLIALVTFFFSMFSIYGSRAASVGSAAILVMILTMDDPVIRGTELVNALFILAGGFWYLLVSLLFHRLQPYRIAQRSLGECIREIARYLSIKSDLYDPDTDLNQAYSRLIAQQVVVNEKQDAVREILFKTRQIVNESTTTGRRLVLTFVETVDLFEDITATFYDYTSLHERLRNTGTLEKISSFIRMMANELNNMGMAIQTNDELKMDNRMEARLTTLGEELDAVIRKGRESNLVLKKIFVNLRRLVYHYHELSDYFDRKKRNPDTSGLLDHRHFVKHQPLGVGVFWNNLTMGSTTFKHALRVSIACLVGFITVKLLSYGHHSYWVIMTIAFLLKPAFSLTRQRNIQRIVGTIGGGLIGILILVLIKNREVLLTLMVLLMIANYSLQRINYLAMVVCLTPFVLILFHLLGVGFLEVAQERVLDTLLGCILAFSAGLFLFPTWEFELLQSQLANNLKANADYLEKIVGALCGKPISLLDYKLARKEVYVQSANLSAAFQRMLSEPVSKQKNSKEVHQFVVLNHILFSNIATVATSLLAKNPHPYPQPVYAAARHAYVTLYALANNIGLTEGKAKNFREGKSLTLEMKDQDDLLMKDQLDFINRIVTDIEKILTGMGARLKKVPDGEFVSLEPESKNAADRLAGNV